MAQNKKTFYPLEKGFLVLWFPMMLFFLILITLSAMNYNNSGWIPIALCGVILIGLIYALLSQRTILYENKITFPKRQVIPNCSNPINNCNNSIEYANLASVEVLDKNNRGTNQYEIGNQTDCIEFIDTKGNSLRLRTRNYNKKQIKIIVAEVCRKQINILAQSK